MEFGLPEDNNKVSLTRFESMLKTNNVLFFDSAEFENIIHHYLEVGKIALAKKAVKLGLDQHPSSVNLKLFQTELCILENKFDEANVILDHIHTLEPNNEEIYIQKANVLSKQDLHEEAVKTLLIALDLAENDEGIGDLFALIGMEYLFLDQFHNARTYFREVLRN